MPPQNQAPTPGENSDPSYNFIFNDQKPKKRFSLRLPGGNNLTRITLLVIAGGVVLGILIIILGSVLGSRGVNKKQLVDIVARAQEISRVSGLISQQFPTADQPTSNLAASASGSLTSEEVQLISYLHKYRVKVGAKDLSFYLNKNIDSQLQTAAQNNNLGATYSSYLKQQLSSYRAAVKNYYPSTPPPAQPILQSAYASSQALLNDSRLASASH